MSKLVGLSRDREVLIIKINNPPVNALSPGVPEGIMNGINAARRDSAVKAVVLIGAGRTFIAGADIKELGRMAAGERDHKVGLHPLMNALEDCPKPVVCAIHGTALGGGLEVAMACHYRIAEHSTRVGQPEVNLGLIPGAGGTQRLPRLSGVARAIEICTKGDPLHAQEALKYGILDRLVDADLLPRALEFARILIACGSPIRKTRELTERLGDKATNSALFDAAREAIRNRDRGRIAPLKAIDAIEAATSLPFNQGIEKETELFEDCLLSNECKALIHVFFGEREVTKTQVISSETPVAAIKKAAVIGAGTMGSGIAIVYANAGIPVILKEESQKALERGMAAIRRHYESSVMRGLMTRQVTQRCLELIRPALGYEGIAEADIVVEAVSELVDVKRRVFHELDKVCWPDAILATTASPAAIDQLAAATSRPFKVIGSRFFVPPHAMKLLEIVRGEATATDVVATSIALAKRLGKTAVLAGNVPTITSAGMFENYQREAQFLVEEGAGVRDVDSALRNFGMALGPLEVEDLSGLDAAWRVRLESGYPEMPGARHQRVADRLCEMGRFGRKTNAGWYRYDDDDRSQTPEPDVERIAEETASDAGISRRSVSAEEIVERTIYTLINEGARLLEAGIAASATDIDIIFIQGYGFPAHRGGPMWFADTVGLPRILERIRVFQSLYGARWNPAALLDRLVREGGSFAGFGRTKA